MQRGGLNGSSIHLIVFCFFFPPSLRCLLWFYGTLDVQIITVYIQQVPMSCCTVLSFFMVNLVNIRSASLMTHLGYVFHTKCGVCQLYVWFVLLCQRLWIASSDLMDGSSSSLHLMIQHSVWWKAFSHLYILPPLPQQHNPADRHSHTPALQSSHHFHNCFLFPCFSISPSNFPLVFFSYCLSLSLLVI